MDLNFAGCNYGALETIRKTEILKKNEQGVIPSSSSVRNACSKLENHMAVNYSLKINEDLLSPAPYAGFDIEPLLRFILKLYKLDELATTSSVVIAVTADGAQFTNTLGHVTVGFKMVDERATDPYTGKLLSTFQSVNHCFPIKSVLAGESRELYTQELGDIYKFFEKLGKDGLAESRFGPKLHVFNVVAPHDGKAAMTILGRGGGAKMAEHFCPFCSIKKIDLTRAESIISLKCDSCRISGEDCLHREIETGEHIEKLRSEMAENMEMCYCVEESFINSLSARTLQTGNTPNCKRNNLHIDFAFNDCEDIQSLYPFYKEIANSASLRQACGKLDSLLVPTETPSSIDDMKTVLRSVVPALSTLISKEKKWSVYIRALSDMMMVNTNFYCPQNGFS